MDNEEEVECNGACEISDWSQWSCVCHFCVPGDQYLHNQCTRTRSQSPECTGLEESCGQLEEEICGDECCDDFCFVSDWSEWGECSANCTNEENGIQERSRTQISQFCLGPPCETLVVNRTCSSTCCPRDCTVLEWSEWSACSAICSFKVGNKRRSRTVIQAECGGIECLDMDNEEEVECNGACAISDWSQWSCTCHFCVPGDQHLHNLCTRTRNQSPECTGLDESCGQLEEEICGDECCDDFCFVSDWSEWGECSANCTNETNGIQERSRTQISQFCLGPPCEVLVVNRTCSSTCCPRDCTVLEWSEWSACSADCSAIDGTRNRTRGFIQGACGGTTCDTDIYEMETCTSLCSLGEWNNWSCSCAFCNPESTSSLYNLCERIREEHGICDGRCGELTEEKCTESCCDDFCATDEWSHWSDCSDGISVRNRNVVSAFCFGDPCGGIQEENICKENCCVYSEWTTWSNCSTNCVETTGDQSRSRTLESECLQNACNDSDEVQSCFGTCHPSDWSAWECTCTFCKAESQILFNNCQRSRHDDSPVFCIEACGPVEETDCTVECCDEFCFWTEWTSWTECQLNERSRSRSQSSTFCIGSPCGSSIEVEECFSSLTTVSASIDKDITVFITDELKICSSTTWTTWSDCYSTCYENNPLQYRNRQLVPMTCNGTQCIETEEETRACQGTYYKLTNHSEFDVHEELVNLHNISANQDEAISIFFSSKSMRERLLIRDKHLAALGYTLSEFLMNVTSHDTHACINVLLECTTQSTTRLLKDLSSGTFDVESILDVIIPLSNQEMLTVQDAYKEEYNTSLETVISNSEIDTAVKRLLGSLLLGMRAESKFVSISQINKDVNRILEGDDIDIQSVLAIRSLEDINNIYEEFTLSNGDLTEFLFDQSEDIYVMGYAKIVSYARNTTDYWAAVFNRLIHVTPFPNNHFTRILVQRAEIDLNGITQRYQELYGRSLEDDVIDNYSGPCKEQAINTINLY